MYIYTSKSYPYYLYYPMHSDTKEGDKATRTSSGFQLQYASVFSKKINQSNALLSRANSASIQDFWCQFPAPGVALATFLSGKSPHPPTAPEYTWVTWKLLPESLNHRIDPSISNKSDSEHGRTVFLSPPAHPSWLSPSTPWAVQFGLLMGLS